MAIQKLHFKVNGIIALLMNNPQTVDRFNIYSRRIAEINAKKTRRTDEDYMELRDLEVRSKMYWIDSKIQIPSRWVTAAIEKVSHSIAKVSKASMRGAVFTTATNLELIYRGMDKVKDKEDIVKNSTFVHLMNIKQGQVRVMKAYPIFHDWSFEGDLEYDNTIVDPTSLERMLKHAAHYGGFGDFRPTFGKAEAIVTYD